jgi:hypothetical protein
MKKKSQKMDMNIFAVIGAALVPLIVGFVWYHPKVLGTAWMKASGVSPEGAENSKMWLVFGLTIVFAFFIAFSLTGIVIHQFGTMGLLSQQPDFKTEGSESSTMLKRFLELYGQSYRTFRHGAFHGALAGLFIATPVLGVNALFERKGFKYIAINGGFWIVTFSLMGGIICAFM